MASWSTFAKSARKISELLVNADKKMPDTPGIRPDVFDALEARIINLYDNFGVPDPVTGVAKDTVPKIGRALRNTASNARFMNTSQMNRIARRLQDLADRAATHTMPKGAIDANDVEVPFTSSRDYILESIGMVRDEFTKRRAFLSGGGKDIEKAQKMADDLIAKIAASEETLFPLKGKPDVDQAYDFTVELEKMKDNHDEVFKKLTGVYNETRSGISQFAQNAIDNAKTEAQLNKFVSSLPKSMSQRIKDLGNQSSIYNATVAKRQELRGGTGAAASGGGASPLAKRPSRGRQPRRPPTPPLPPGPEAGRPVRRRRPGPEMPPPPDFPMM